MMSWFSRHRPRRRGAKKSTVPPSAAQDVALVGISTGVPPRPPQFRPRRQDTDATLVDGSDLHSVSETHSFEYDSLPIKKERAPRRVVKTSASANPDDPSLWKKSQLQHSDDGLQCFGPVPLDCEPPQIASGTTHSISTILEASIVVGEASNIPYLKGLAGIILLVSNSVQATEDNRVDCTRLSKMVLDLASVAARHLEQNADPHQFSWAAFTRILQALQSSIKRSYARRFIECSNEKDLLRDCEKELQHCLDVFQIRSHIATSVAFKRKDTADEVFADQLSNALLPVKNLLAQAVPHSDATLEVSEVSDEPVDLPPRPQIFNGRDSELSELVQMFTQPDQAHAVLMGQGGAGKSSLALAFMHQPEIKQHFRHQRFLVKCNSAKGSFDLLSRLGSALGLPDVTAETKSSGYKETIFASLACSQVPSLIVFDDLVEDLLTELSNIPTVSLLSLSRHTTCCRQTFFAISDVPDDDEDAPLVDVLLHMVGFLPMPITLLAQLAQYEPISFLLERYREEGTSMLDGGDVSMEESIEATLYSARVSECPAALEVLGILARFPDGTPKRSGGRLPGAMVNKCLSVLHKTSLAVVVPRDQDARQQERLKVPEVVRTYLERHVLDGGRFRSTEEL
ncbi:hypothetical protein B0H13DRAFT_1965477 [Mycena leptocephala]|nr:hypothetical protein B0H13DRAFT_1965477 [Mycena leptocephala]